MHYAKGGTHEVPPFFCEILRNEKDALRHSKYAMKAPTDQDGPSFFLYGVCLTEEAGGECQPARDLRRLDREC